MGVLCTMSSQARWKGLIKAISKEQTDSLKIYKTSVHLGFHLSFTKCFYLSLAISATKDSEIEMNQTWESIIKFFFKKKSLNEGSCC